MKKIGLVCSLATLSLVLSATAYAGPILTSGNVPQSGDENVLLNTGAIGNPLFGSTNQTSLSVQFLSNETLVAPSNGQARVEAQDGSLTYLDVSLPGGTFMSLIFNLDASANGTIDFSGFDSGGNAFSFPNVALKGSGSNYFTFTTNGLPFVNVSLFTDIPVVLTDAEQFRIGGSSLNSSDELPPSSAAVPEPVSLLLVGSGLLGGVARMRRRVGR
jgi:hypothetical protein